MVEPGTVFLERYRFEFEAGIETFTCPDCGGRCAIVIRAYTDLHSEGGNGRVETSVRTSCHCAEEFDPFRNERPALHTLSTNSADWRVYRGERKIYRVRED